MLKPRLIVTSDYLLCEYIVCYECLAAGNVVCIALYVVFALCPKSSTLVPLPKAIGSLSSSTLRGVLMRSLMNS